MTTERAQLSKAAVVLSAAMFLSATASAGTVYDNSQNNLNRIFHAPATSSGGKFELGDQIFLDGTDRRITSFQFECFVGMGTAGVETAGNETAELFFYANNGGASGVGPGTLLFRSGEFNLLSGFQTVVAQGLSVQVPDTFTWTVAFGGVDLGEEVGLLHFNPPMVGASFDDLWLRNSDGSWVTLLIDRGATSANFGAVAIAASQPATLFLTAITPGGDRTWSAQPGLSSGPAQVQQVHLNGTSTVILSGTMLANGKFLNPITDFGFEDGMLWLVHHQVNPNGLLVKAISVFDPDNAANTFTTVAASQLASPVPATNVTPGEDPTRTPVVGASNGLIVIVPGNIRGAPVASTAPPAVDLNGIIAGEDPRRTPAGGASVPADLNHLITLPGEFLRPPPTLPPTPVTEITPGEDPRRSGAAGASFPGIIITMPSLPSTRPAPTPVTIIGPGEDATRSSEITGPKQEQRKSVSVFNIKKITK